MSVQRGHTAAAESTNFDAGFPENQQARNWKIAHNWTFGDVSSDAITFLESIYIGERIIMCLRFVQLWECYATIFPSASKFHFYRPYWELSSQKFTKQRMQDVNLVFSMFGLALPQLLFVT